MPATLYAFIIWLVVNAIIQPFAIWLGASLALVQLRSRKAPLPWTRPDEVQDHPLFLKEGRATYYLGGLQYPLPWKFALIQNCFAPVLVMGLTLNQPLSRAGLSFGMCLAVQLLATIIVLVPLLMCFRRVQPRWLTQHLATLPPDAKPMPATEGAVNANAIP